MKTFCTHTLVCNGMPFIDLVLRQVIPFASRCLITVSKKSTDGTIEVLNQLKSEFPEKIFIDMEDQDNPGKLTSERQKMIEKTTEDWILFLDDDDAWSREALQSVVAVLNDEVDGYAVNPYQLVDSHTVDANWWNKWFTKLFRNQPGLHYVHPWPKDEIWLNNKMLYWKKNPRVVKLPDVRYFHLSGIKYSSFRREKWAKDFEFTDIKMRPLPPGLRKDIDNIYLQYVNYPQS